MLLCIPLLPFVGFLINATLGRRLSKGVSGGVACLAMLGAFAVSALASRGSCWQLAGRGARHRARRSSPGSPPATSTPPLAFRLDPLVDADDPRRHRHRLADPHLLDGLHARGDATASTRATSPT